MTEVARRRIHHHTAHTESGLRPDALAMRALEVAGGAVLVVDASLRIVGATRAAERVLGAPVPAGAHAVRVLAGDTETAIAEVFAGERAVTTTIAAGHPGHETRARLRITPIRDAGTPVLGWVVRLTEEPGRRGVPHRLESMWTQDEATKRVLSTAELVAGCDASVLVSGEMGVGKSSLAAAIHAHSARRAHPLRTLACAVMTPAVLEAQLVGMGPAELTCTLLLDEIGDLPHEAQGFLLRVLESGVVTPIEGGAPIPVDVRTLATTSRPLEPEVQAGRFRADLLVHLRTVALELRPLRARPLDVPLLAEKLLAELGPRSCRGAATIGEEALARLVQYPWPGNVRELRAAIEHALATGRGPVIVPADLPAAVLDPGAVARVVDAAPPAHTAERGERARIVRALERAGGDRTRAAAMLGMSRTTLWRRMRTHGVES